MVLQSPPETQHPKSEDGGGWIVLAFAVLAAAYLPTRLVEEANPEWRLVSWALALVVVGLTWLLLARTGLSSGLPGPGFRAQHAKARLQTLAFSLPPLAFFLVAVPLPTVIEAPLIRGLTAANTAVTVEVVNWLGVAAVQQGNTIQVVTGSVGIDEACSGIRSFQVALMLALFFGEVYRLKPGRRVALCVVGLALSFVFNVARTTLLTCVAASQGVGAVASWHDPAGAAILVGCFLSILLIARRSRISEDGLGGRREETKTAE
ncbi:MAG TPA: exosortase/archaeosortase family protein, partial [Verrucomicrobiae bacterium]